MNQHFTVSITDCTGECEPAGVGSLTTSICGSSYSFALPVMSTTQADSGYYLLKFKHITIFFLSTQKFAILSQKLAFRLCMGVALQESLLIIHIPCVAMYLKLSYPYRKKT